MTKEEILAVKRVIHGARNYPDGLLDTLNKLKIIGAINTNTNYEDYVGGMASDTKRRTYHLIRNLLEEMQPADNRINKDN